MAQMFAKRHYETVALILKEARDIPADQQLDFVTEALTRVFKLDNDRFDADRFKRAVTGERTKQDFARARM